MTSSYRFLVHRIFQQQAEAFLERNSAFWDSFLGQCRKACADPFKAGKPLQRVGIEALRGKICRLWVGGPNKYRFIYIVDPVRKMILPVLLTLEVKGRIDYDKLPWEEYAEKIYEDLVQNNMDAFKILRLS